jgi:hypothetical protein
MGKGRSPRVTRLDEKDFFEAPPLLPGAEVGAYEELLRAVTKAIQPKNVIEKSWVRDWTYYSCEISLLRRLKAALMSDGLFQKLQDFLEGYEGVGDLLERYFEHDTEAVDLVESLLAEQNQSIDMMTAEVFAKNIERIQNFDAMLASFERRRNASLRELDRRRAVLSLLQRTVDHRANSLPLERVRLEPRRAS